jgi:acyl carrier protein
MSDKGEDAMLASDYAAIQGHVTECVALVLNLDKEAIAPHDDLQALGAGSFDLVALVAKIEGTYGIHVRLDQLRPPTVDGLARFVLRHTISHKAS